MTYQIQLYILEFLFSFLKLFLQHAPCVLRSRPGKGQSPARSRSACETLVIGQFLRRARDFPPNAEKKFYALNNLFKSLLRN